MTFKYLKQFGEEVLPQIKPVLNKILENVPGLRTTFLPVCPVAKSVAIKVLMEVSQASVKHSKMLPNIPRATKLALWCP